MSGTRTIAVVGGVGLLLLFGALRVAGADRPRLQEAFEPALEEQFDGRTHGSLDDDTGGATREVEQTEAATPPGLYEAALAATPHELSSTAPGLAGAIGRLGEGQSVALQSMILVDVFADDDAGFRFEQATYSDSVGYLMIFWQDLPPTSNQQVMVAPSADVQREGELDIVIDSRDLPGSRLRIVRVLDGNRVLSVEVNNIPGLEIPEIRLLALSLFHELP